MRDAAMRVVAALSSTRLDGRLNGLARFGGRADGGVDRLALTPEELAARRWLVEPFLGRSGYDIAMDDAANLFIRRHGDEPDSAPVLVGSHIDTQPAGGRFDGAFGVCAGLEILDALDDAGARTRRPVEVVVWNNEEGVRFAPGLTGSGAFVEPGRLAEFAELASADGATMAEACAIARQDLADYLGSSGHALIDSALKRPIRTYIEAHIEQGPILERKGVPVGCVEAIQAVRWKRIVIRGRSAHAGTTPTSCRDDAMSKAIGFAHDVLMAGQAFDEDLRLTIGQWNVAPNAVNTIANRVAFTFDMRHPRESCLDRLDELMRLLLPPGSEMQTLFEKPTVGFDDRISTLIGTCCADLGIPFSRVGSGAFHDALNLASHCPTAMVFAPSAGGISHHPDEFTGIDDLIECTRVVALAAVRLCEVTADGAAY